MQKESKKNKIQVIENKTYTPMGFHIEIDKIAGRVSVCVNGVSSVLDFGEECAVLKMRGGKLKISGLELAISVYENKVAEISGKVGTIEFL